MLRSGTSLEDEQRLLKQATNTMDEQEATHSDICSADMEPTFDLHFTSDSHELQDSETENRDAFEEAWVPLVRLVSKLQYLVELNYACVNQFPSGLLEALHRYHTSCRLNLNWFRFHSLNNAETDPRELELIRSPCLHGLTTRHVVRDSDGIDDYNEDAIMETVGIAPNLREVRLYFCLAHETGANVRRRFTPKERPWKGFIPPFPSEDPPRKGNLTSLSLSRIICLTENRLDQWSLLTDLSKLQSLSMGRINWPSPLIRATEMGAFKSLEKLAIRLEMSLEAGQSQPVIEMFFESLRPLKTLRLHGMMDMKLVQTILERHGPSMQELLIHPRWGGIRYDIKPMALSSTDISTLAKCCPLVRELSLIINRSMSDRHEVACYRALGEFQLLEKLSLELDCSVSRMEWSDRLLDEFDKQVYTCISGREILNFHMRDAFVNTAVDEKLAQSIWDVVTTSQSQSGRLSSLEIRPCQSGISSFKRLSCSKWRQMSRCFKVTGGGWGRAGVPLEIVEIGKETRERVDRRVRRNEALYIEKWGHLDWASVRQEAIMQRIWPSKTGSPDWRRDWSSWPLAL